ncbi:MAG TPA: peroxidase family protein [Gaiellaceae bacterium]|jgi:hypothetical protein
MTSGSPVEVAEPISPELVLVAPPEAARIARERLGDEPRSVLSEPISAARPDALPPASPSPPARRAPRRWLRVVIAAAALVLGALAALLFLARGGGESAPAAARSLDGAGNNLDHPDWGEMGKPYVRVAKPNYADRIGRMVSGPSPRYISNRIFNDLGQNVLSERNVSQWGWVWGQFLDHTFGLRNERPGESAPIPFDAGDPDERFRDDLGKIDFSRTPATLGTGRTVPRQETNTVQSYIDAFAIYGGTSSRLEWLRNGPVDGTLADNEATLMLPGGYLPQANARGNAAQAPAMDLMGPIAGHPASAVVSGDVRANENIGLTAVHTLFAREHNRIVSLLPRSLPEAAKFGIARRVVGAEQQYITYQEFLPALGIHLPPYRGYDPTVDPSISNEFATVGYRVHSMVHGEFEPEVPASTYTRRQLDAFGAGGVAVEREGGKVKLVAPLGLAYGNPSLLQSIGLGPLLEGLGDERQYRNDEQIDDSMRSVLFQIPKPGARDPTSCGTPIVRPGCFSVVQDLGAIDVQRGRDHGMPYYNQMRIAYGLKPKPSYAAITGETARFPRRVLFGVGRPIDNPASLEFTRLLDADGDVVPPHTDEAAEDVVSAERRTSLASRLRAIYGPGNVNKVDAFVGMLSEPHVPGTEFGELQLAMWQRQFEALRDGDRFFYLNDPALDRIRDRYGTDYRQTLAHVIELNTNATVRSNPFFAPAS